MPDPDPSHRPSALSGKVAVLVGLAGVGLVGGAIWLLLRAGKPHRPPVPPADRSDTNTPVEEPAHDRP